MSHTPWEDFPDQWEARHHHHTAKQIKKAGNLNCLFTSFVLVASVAWTGFLVWAIWALVTWIISK